MTKQELKKLIDIAAGRIPADVVIKNCRVVDVYSGTIRQGDIALCDEKIAGVGAYDGMEVIDAEGRYAAPGFIDSHIHIESSYVTPEEISRLLVPHGAATIIADPHEIVNVCGICGLDYMMEAAQDAALDIKFMLPSCVPATPFENAGAVIDAEQMREPITRGNILGLGEFMNYAGVIDADDAVLDKLLVAINHGKLIDGHAPTVMGSNLNAYSAPGIRGDHECATVEEMQARISCGMYVLLRQGSACHNLRPLLKGVTPENSRRCLLCSDDRQPKTIFKEGHIDNHLRICVEEGLDPVSAIRMATLNAAECWHLSDRGAIAPGLRADIVLLDDLKDFRVRKVWLAGKLCAVDGDYLPAVHRHDISAVKGSLHLKDFSVERLRLPLKSDYAHVIQIIPGGVVSKNRIARVSRDENGNFRRDPSADIVKVAIVERHKYTGNVAVALLGGYGIQRGAVALSVAHDSHNIIAVGVSDEEMACAVKALVEQEGGIVLVRDGRVIERMPMPVAGLMSDQSGQWVDERLTAIHEAAFQELGIADEVDPIMTLCFMSLPVIPELKLTDMGLFDVMNFSFTPVDAERPEKK